MLESQEEIDETFKEDYETLEIMKNNVKRLGGKVTLNVRSDETLKVD